MIKFVKTLIIISVIVVVGLCSYYYYIIQRKNLEEKKLLDNRSIMLNICYRLMDNAEFEGVFVKDLNSFDTGGMDVSKKGEFVDAWSHPIIYKVSEDRMQATIASYGINGLPGGQGNAQDWEVIIKKNKSSNPKYNFNASVEKKPDEIPFKVDVSKRRKILYPNIKQNSRQRI